MYYRITSNQTLHKPEKCKPKKLLKGTVLTNEKRGWLKMVMLIFSNKSVQASFCDWPEIV
jgi:hypothetical protein